MPALFLTSAGPKKQQDSLLQKGDSPQFFVAWVVWLNLGVFCPLKPYQCKTWCTCVSWCKLWCKSCHHSHYSKHQNIVQLEPMVALNWCTDLWCKSCLVQIVVQCAPGFARQWRRWRRKRQFLLASAVWGGFCDPKP